MILVDWMQSLLISMAVKTHQRGQARDLEILEERIHTEIKE